MPKNNNIKRAKRLVKGLIISWSDDKPLTDNAEITNQRVTHRNPVLRPSAMKVWREYGDYIVNHSPHLWRITITPVFEYSKADQLESRQVVHYMVLNDLAGACNSVIEEALRYGENLKQVDFNVECLGDRPKQDQDYEEGYEK